MVKVLKIFVICSATLMSGYISAYTFTFNNKTNSDIEVKWQLVGIEEPIETLVIAANGSNSRSFGGLRVGLCISTDTKTLSARKLPNGNVVYPLIISRDSKAYSELLKTNMVTSVDFGYQKPCKGFTGTADAALKCNPEGIMCFNLEFEIRETDDNHLVLISKLRV